jgi:hypothetical protein
MAFQFGFVCITLSADGADVRLKRKQKDNDNKVQSEMLKNNNNGNILRNLYIQESSTWA